MFTRHCIYFQLFLLSSYSLANSHTAGSCPFSILWPLFLHLLLIVWFSIYVLMCLCLLEVYWLCMAVFRFSPCSISSLSSSAYSLWHLQSLAKLPEQKGRLPVSVYERGLWRAHQPALIAGLFRDDIDSVWTKKPNHIYIAHVFSYHSHTQMQGNC